MSHLTQKNDTFKQDGWMAWRTCIVASLFLSFVMFQLNALNILDQSIIQTFHLSSSQFGQLSAAFFYGNVFFYIPAGMILDRISAKKVLLMMSITACLGTWIFATSHHFYIAALARGLIGFTGAFAFLGILKLNARWFSQNWSSQASALCLTFSMLGGMMAQAPLQTLLMHMNWRQALHVTVIIGALISILILCLIQDCPKIVTQEAAMPIRHTLIESIRNKNNWFCGCVICFLNLPNFIFGAGWGMMYLTQFYHIDRTHGAEILSMIFLGMIIGSPLMSYLSDHFYIQKVGLQFKIKRGQNRPQFLLLATMGMILLLSLCLLHPNMTWQTLALIFFCMGLLSATRAIGYPHVAHMNPPERNSTAVGIALMLVMAGGFLQPLFGYLLALKHDVIWTHHLPHYSAFDFRLGLVFMLSLLLLSLYMGQTLLPKSRD